MHSLIATERTGGMAGMQSNQSYARMKLSPGIDLKHILSQNRRSSQAYVLVLRYIIFKPNGFVLSQKIDDKSYHKILEASFRLISNECSKYTTASKDNLRNKAAVQLSACAGVVRMAVDMGVKKMRSKTVKALVEHITQTLPMPNKEYCEPLLIDYFKSLRTVLEYQPHLDYLSRAEWLEVVEFCNKTLHNLNAASSAGHAAVANGLSSVTSFRSRHGRSPTPGTPADYGLQASNRGSQRIGGVSLRNIAEDLVLCIKNLVSASNAPILDQAEATLKNLCDLLATLSSPGIVLQTVFESINAIVTQIMTDDISLMMQTMGNILPNIWRLWDIKSPTLKDHMLISLLYGEVYFSRLASTDEPSDCVNDLSRLLQVFRQEYSKRPEREQLQLEDLDLPDQPFCSERPLSMKAFELRSAASRAEQPWTMLYISASIILVLSADDSARGKSVDAPSVENPPKRRKLDKPINEILADAKSTDVQRRLFALQVLAFVFDRIVVDVESLNHYLEPLLQCLSDDNANIVSWALLVMTRYSVHRAHWYEIVHPLTELLVLPVEMLPVHLK